MTEYQERCLMIIKRNLNNLINATPTGKHREDLTKINMLLLSLKERMK